MQNKAFEVLSMKTMWTRLAMIFSWFVDRPCIAARQKGLAYAASLAAIGWKTTVWTMTVWTVVERTVAEDFPAIYNSPAEAKLLPLPADEAASRMKVPEGFRVQVFAAEPDVQNPIAVAWDERRRLWVAENYTYSDKSQRFDLSLRDRVIILEDLDHDGRADKRTVFTDKVQMLTSVEVGRGGVWLMCPPQLLFIPDADGDDIADGPTQVMLDGFTVARDNYHNFANGLRWGPDGWLYGRCGHSCPGEIGPPGTASAERIPIDGGLWRYHPEKKKVEVLCHGTVNPWGHDWDRHGELFFINTVIGHLWHCLPGSHFKESFGESMNPSVYERIDTIADHYHFDRKGSWTDSRDGKANDLGGGHAHIGMMIYQGQQWPEAYRHKLFTLNMHGQRANVERLERHGAGYVGRHEPDFLVAGEDPFFRGMEISTGPDGSVYVVDWSDTGECHEHNGVHRTSGRIYKISYGAARGPGEVIKPSCLAGDGKLPQLWRRYQSGKTTPEELRQLLQDPDEHVRVWAIRLLSDHWPLDTVRGPLPNQAYPDDPKTFAALLQAAAEDRSGLVQLVLASTLQRLPLSQRVALASRLMLQSDLADDPTFPQLLWYGIMPIADTSPHDLVRLAAESRLPLLTRYASRRLAVDFSKHPERLGELLSLVPGMPPALQEAVILGTRDAFRGWRKAQPPEHWPAIAASSLAQRLTQEMRELGLLFGDGRALAELSDLALDGQADLKTRTAALESLIEARPVELRQVCEKLLDTRVINAVAMRGLALFDAPEIGDRLARAYRKFHPDDRPAVLDLLVSRPIFTNSLLANLGEHGARIPITDVTAVHARQIRSHADEDLNRQLGEVWGELRDSPSERRTQIEQTKTIFAGAAASSVDLADGRRLFQRTCAQCHRLFGEGEAIGPDLTGAQRTSLDYLLENILDPSAVVGKDYRMTVLRTEDGRVLNGLLVSRDEQAFVLQTFSARERILVEEVEEVKTTSQSAMPDGLLENLTTAQIRNLLSYLMHASQVPLAGE
jgi:putative membrane-bound dehydrogenase-like protein